MAGKQSERVGGYFVIDDDDREQADPEPPGPFMPLVAEWELSSAAEIQWLVEAMLPAGALALLYAPSGAGKSFVAIDLALSTCTASFTWFGHAIPTHRPAVYVAGEGWPGIAVRVAAWKDRMQIDGPTYAFFRPGPLNLLDDVAVSAFIAQLADADAELEGVPPGVVVCDTLAACLGGESDNAPESMIRATENGHRIARDTGATVVLVHHTGHNQTRPRGHTALVASCDVVMRLEADGTDLTLKCDKARDFEPFQPVYLGIDQHCKSAVLVDRDPGTDQSFTPRHRDLLAVLADLGDQGTCTTWLQAATESLGVSRRTFYRARGFLLDAGWIVAIGRRYALTSQAVTATNGATAPRVTVP